MNIIRSATLALLRRWRRNLLTVAAMVVGASALVSVLAISQTSAQHLADTVNRLQSNTVAVTLPEASWQLSERALVGRSRSLASVLQAGTFVTSNAGAYPVDVQQRVGAAAVRVGSIVATQAGCDARGARVIAGGFPTEDADQTDAVLLGSALAKQLGRSTADGANALIVNGVHLTVTGIIRDGGGQSDANTAVILPPTTAQRLAILPSNRLMQLVTVDGAVDSVARAAPTSIFPTDPAGVSVGTQPSPTRLRDELLAGSRSLVVTISAVMVGATIFGIVTTMQIAVWERRRELGVARAMGETRLSVGLRFLIEATGLGVAGGLIGYILGVLVSAAVAQANGWTFVLPPIVVAVVPLSGVVGAAAGSVPAWRASRVSPASLLRAD